MWCHLPTIFKRRHVLRTAALIALCVGIITTQLFAASTHAAPGVNQVIGFQGRLLSASGGVVPDGTYNIQFKIYQDGTGQTAGDPDGSLKWTETYTSGTGGGISVKNGYFSVDLGSRNAFGLSVDWNQDTLWLSMNIAGSTTCTTFGSDCTADGEMLPMKRIDSVPYAMNAGTVGGKSASDLIQNGTTQQTADFNISGTGTATTLQGNTSIITPLLDTQNTGDVLSIGTTKAGGVTIGKTNGSNTVYGGTTMNGPLTLGGTSTTNFAMSVSQTLNSSLTTSIEGIQNQLNINPQGATLSNLYGMVNLPVISGGSAAIANAFGMYTRLDTTSGFTGTIDTANGLTVGGPNLGSSGDANGIKIGTYSGLNIAGPSQNGGNTGGTITNYGIQLQGNTATAGAGGTVNNLGISIVMPSGGAAGAGTTKNIGLNLSGNGGTNATNWAIYSSSTASSYLQGNVMIGTGSNPNNYALNVSGTANASALYAPTVDTASASALNIGTVNATSINLGQNTTLAAGKSLTLTGGATSTRPSSPTEGMIYYDTDTKQLLIYSNGKWQADRSSNTAIVSTSASGGTSGAVASKAPDGADFVNTSATSAQTTINNAIASLPSQGGTVYLMEGTYVIDGTISLPNNVTLTGAGSSTIIKLKNGINSDINAITNSDTNTGTKVGVNNLALDGNMANNTSGTQRGIYFDTVGLSSSSSPREGGKVSDVSMTGFRNEELYLDGSQMTTVTDSSFGSSSDTAIGLGSNAVANTLSHNHISNAGSDGIHLNGSGTDRNIISGNTIEHSTNDGIDVLGSGNTVTGNTIIGGGVSSFGIFMGIGSQNTVTGNTLDADGTAQYGIGVFGTTSSNIANNTITSTLYFGVALSSAAAHNTITGNTITNSGGPTGNNAIDIQGGSDNNSLTNNSITDSSATSNNYAIKIEDNASDNTYISNNQLGSGASISDSGTGTTYANQLDVNGKLIDKSAAGLNITTSSNTANALTVQNTSNASVLTVNTNDNSVLVAGRLDTTAAGALTLGNANATSIAIGNPTTSITNSIYGSTILKSATDGASPVVFQLQQANGTPMLTADSNAQTITIGNATSGDKMVISTANGQVTYYGSARRTKQISLSPEYNNSVLDAGTGSNNTGTMTSSVDLTNRMNYYKWTTNQSSNQSYDVDVQIPLPTDFDGWASSNPLSVSTYTSDTTNGTITLEARDSTNAVQCNFVSVTPTSTGTWTTNNSACTLSSGTYTAGNYITLRVRMQSPNGGDVRLGNINLSYLSKF